jgi:hypothetical protein
MMLRLLSIYLQTLSISDFDTENAEAAFCHLKYEVQSLFSFIKCMELSATMVAIFSSDNFGDREIRK